MRDIVLTLVVMGLLPFILRSPVIGAYAWAWLGMMNPNRAVFGFARSLPFSQVVAIATLLSLLMNKKDRKPFPVDAISITLLLLMVWMSVTSFFAINPKSDMVLDRWIFVLKIQFMIWVTMMLVRGRKDIERLIWVMTLSIGFYGFKGGFWTLVTGGSVRIWGPAGGMIEGNNELAVALAMLVPMMVYLIRVSTGKWVRRLLILGTVLMTFSILGSQSRGALLALVAMGFFLGIKGKHPVRSSVLIGVLLATAIAFMPDSWTQRMDTIQEYQADGSAMQRIYTWKTLWNCALDRPLVGAGFHADNLDVFNRYAPRGGEFEHMYQEGMLRVAHSIYFQMLGEHGFPGVGLFILLGLLAWRMAGQLAKETKDHPVYGSWVPQLAPMIQVSLVGYAVGGAFLSLGYFDLPYYIVALVSVLRATIREDKSAGLPATPRGAPRGLIHPSNRGQPSGS
ncbi:MAG: putative O-glycosylation ligase, exosortase A system-associated [Burkholderiales bacterium]|nr:putative O-glycosylation ligase, exosortase A system-associated [Burkholderiales bacterium]